MSTDFLKRWMELFFWWVPREAPKPESSSAAAPAATDQEAGPAQSPEPSEPPPPTEPAQPDDLTVLKGIGPAIQDKLHAFGIRTFRDLAAADAEALTEQLKSAQTVISQNRVEEWIASARERA